jgi:hypothetical protein
MDSEPAVEYVFVPRRSGLGLLCEMTDEVLNQRRYGALPLSYGAA